jgi:hypothetical protein
MKNNSVVHFVGFVTNLEPGEFVPLWESYAKRLMKKETVALQQLQVATSKKRFRYISQHECHDGNIYFSFMKGNRSEYFTEHNAKVIQIGGYQQVQTERGKSKNGRDLKLLALLDVEKADLGFYSGLSLYSHLTVYEAYYESCMYNFILEFSVSENDVELLEQQIKLQSNAEAGICRECKIFVSKRILA